MRITIQSSAEMIYTYCIQFIWGLFSLFLKKKYPLLGIEFSRDYIILTIFIVCLNGALIMLNQIDSSPNNPAGILYPVLYATLLKPAEQH